MSKKLKTRRGTTIAEMLIAVALLALLTAGGAVAASAVLASYHHMRDAANADILASTVIETLSNEVRLGRDIQDPGTSGSNRLELNSAFFGEGATLTLDTYGHLVATTTADPTAKQLLSESTYAGLRLDALTFTRTLTSAGKPVYTVGFTVNSGAGSSPLWTGSAAASPLQ